MRSCDWCGAEMITQRRDAVCCSTRCRQARHRFMRGTGTLATADRPLRLAYADPPYPGQAGIYREHPDYAGEVDHQELVMRLASYDGWALSTSGTGSMPTQGASRSVGTRRTPHPVSMATKRVGTSHLRRRTTTH